MVGGDEEAGGAPNQADAPARPDPARLTRAERIFVRISVLQTILAVAGVFTGCVALYAALHESAAVRRQSAAVVWPYVQTAIVDHRSAAGSHFAVTMTNAGVGPAKITAIKLTVDGAPARGWRQALAAIVERQIDYGHQFANGRVLRAGETIRQVAIEDDAAAVAALQTAVYSGRALLEFCYCSIFDECWLYEPARPEPRRRLDGACPAYGDAAFLD